MSGISKLRNKAAFFAKSLQTFEHFGGLQETARGCVRILLQKPSDTARKIRWKFSRYFIPTNKLIINLPKFDIIVPAADEGIGAELSLDGFHEPLGTEVLCHILKDDMTVVDIGANVGFFVLQEATTCKLRQIIAIEPNPAAFELLKDNVELNHLENVELQNVAISDVDTELPFYISKKSNISSITPKREYENIITVPVQRLDALIAALNIKQVDLVRMDLEGHEINVLAGMQKILRRDHPWLCLEYHSPIISEEQREFFIQTLTELDYELKAFMFRWSDYPIFGRTIVDKSNVLHTGELADVLRKSPTQTLLLYLAHKSAPFEFPAL